MRFARLVQLTRATVEKDGKEKEYVHTAGVAVNPNIISAVESYSLLGVFDHGPPPHKRATIVHVPSMRWPSGYIVVEGTVSAVLAEIEAARHDPPSAMYRSCEACGKILPYDAADLEYDPEGVPLCAPCMREHEKEVEATHAASK